MWKGGVPIFQASLIVRARDMLENLLDDSLRISNLKNKITEAKDCVKKYLNLIISGVASLIVIPRIGINKIMLISMTAHNISGLLTEIPKMHLIINIEIKNVLVNQEIKGGKWENVRVEIINDDNRL